MLLKKKTKIVLIVIVIAVILVSFIGGQAYAKYMSKVTGNGVGEIAQWRFKVNENEENDEKHGMYAVMCSYGIISYYHTGKGNSRDDNKKYIVS